jgi:LPXTG-motif cell wall-anchored protein
LSKDTDTPSGNNNTALVIGIAAGAIVLIAILAYLFMRKKKSVKLQKDLEKQNTLLEEVQLD